MIKITFKIISFYNKEMNITVIGSGYVGLVSGLVLQKWEIKLLA